MIWFDEVCIFLDVVERGIWIFSGFLFGIYICIWINCSGNVCFWSKVFEFFIMYVLINFFNEWIRDIFFLYLFDLFEFSIKFLVGIEFNLFILKYFRVVDIM